MKGWYGNKVAHSLASRGIKTSTVTTEFPKLKNPKEREYLYVEGYDESVMSFSKKNFVNFLEELFWNWNDGKDEYDFDYIPNLYEKYKAKVIDRREFTFPVDIEDRLDAGIHLHRQYVDLGMIDKAVEVRDEIQRMGVINIEPYKSLEEGRYNG